MTHSISTIPAKVRKLLLIVTELEEEYHGRHFTLDGHLVGSIGEVLAEYYYGIHLYDSSFPIHDGWVGEGVARREIQIKTTQRNTVMMSSKPDYLIVLYLSRDGSVYEIYNGPGEEPWNSVAKADKHSNKHIRVNKLMELGKGVMEDERIAAVHEIKKMLQPIPHHPLRK